MKRLILIATFILFQITGADVQAQSITVISGATLIDGTGNAPLPNSVIIIKGGRIIRIGTAQTVKIPQNAHMINAIGKYILPGLIDTHLHLEYTGISDLGELPDKWNKPEKVREIIIKNTLLNLISGFTTVRDMGSTELVLQVRDEINSNKLIGSSIIAAGMQLVKKDPEAQRVNEFLEYDGIKDAREKTKYLKKLNVDVIKIRLTNMRPIPSLEELKTIVEEAHNSNLKATVHTDVPADELVKLAIDAGADGIEHNAPLRPKNESILSLMAGKGMSLMAGAGHSFCQRIDTTGLIDSLDEAQVKFFTGDILNALHSGIDSLHRQTRLMKNNGWDAKKRQESFITEINQARKEKVLLIFGTDCGANAMIHGEQYNALYGESRMGSSPMEAILMATRDAAKAIGREKEIGTIEEGKTADIVILNENPLTDLRNLHKIFRVIKKGVVYNPADLKMIKYGE